MKYYIGIDPDLRLLNAAIVTEEKKPLAVFIRRNKEEKGDLAVAMAARLSCRLIEDVIAFFTAQTNCKVGDEIITVVESQNIQYTGHTNTARKQNVLQVAQVAGCLMGAFSNMSDRIHLVQPNTWKGQVPKYIHHTRIYRDLNLISAMGSIKNIYPIDSLHLRSWSHDKINPGDFADINDSLGLALYGAMKKL